MFQKMHEVKFGMTIAAQDATTGEDTSCACSFCMVFGREDKVGGKQATNHCKYLDRFRTYHYLQHLKHQHHIKWVEYEKLVTADEKEAFFKENDEPFVNRIETHLESSGRAMIFGPNKSIVDDIIGGFSFILTVLKALRCLRR